MPYKRLAPKQKLALIKSVLEHGESVSSACQRYGVSRKSFYQWLKRYQEAEENRKLYALSPVKPDRPSSINHPHKATAQQEEAVLNLIYKNPHLSSRIISGFLPTNAKGKPLLSEYGVRKVLGRLNLSHVEDRIKFAEQFAPKPTFAPAPRFIPLPRWLTDLPFLTHLPPPLLRQGFEGLRKAGLPSPSSIFSWVLGLSHRLRNLRYTLSPASAILSAFSFLFAIGTAILTRNLLASQSTLTGKIGILFSEVSLIAGFFFFLYSMKYYFTLAMVLAYSRQKGVGSEGRIQNGNQRLGSRLLGKVNGFVNGAKNSTPNKLTRYQDNNLNNNGLSLNNEHLDNFDTEISNPTHQPFISIHIPLYNEKRVVERVIRACAQQDYQNFEVLVLDDSTDETTQIAERVALEINEKVRNETRLRPSGFGEARGWDRVRVLHRPTRQGFKGGALGYALENVHPKTEYIMVFDADFVPFPDTIKQFLRYFKLTTGTIHPRSRVAVGKDELRIKNYESRISSHNSLFDIHNSTPPSPIAAICGYQWHVLNKNENWITRGVRTEYSGSYIIERSGQELLGLMKLIHGSVYMIRRDALEDEGIGWGTSITEDFELTLKLYAKGYKVVYTPYIQAPSECVSTLKRLIRQRMRWAEGHSHCVRRMFKKLMFGDWEEGMSNVKAQISNPQLKSQNFLDSPPASSLQHPASATEDESKQWVSSPLTFREKLEFLYLSPYYLQSALFMIGNLAWFMAEAVFHVRLPYWTELWGWSLVFTNMFSLPLINGVGLFIEEADSRDYLGLLSFVALCYLLVPFQAYASIKGFLEPEEGTWFRTPKTGHITIDVVKGTFSRLLGFLSPGRREAPAVITSSVSLRHSELVSESWRFGNNQILKQVQDDITPHLALATAGNQFSNFRIKKRKMKWLTKTSLIALLILSLNLSWLSFKVPLAHASPGTQVKTIEMPIYQYASATDIAGGSDIQNGTYASSDGPSFALNIPETLVDCRSDLTGTNPCYAYVEWRTILDDAGGDVTAGEMKFKKSGGTSKTLSLTTLNANSAESQPLIMRMDVTDKVEGGNNTYYFNVYVNNAPRNTDSAKLIVTYEYDDSSTTQVKTVRYALGTQAAQGASGDCGPDVTVNPNIQEAGVSIQKAWVEMTGQVSAGTTDVQAAVYFGNVDCASGEGYALGNGATNNTYIDGANKTTMDFVAMYEPLPPVVAFGATIGQLNYNASNTISLYNTGQVMNLKGGELLITYNYSYYNQTSTTHRNTVRYYVGQDDGASSNIIYETLGSPAVYLPETLASPPNYNAYLKVVGTNVDNTGTRYRVTINSVAQEYPGAATYYAAAVSEQAGREVIFIDISDHFNTNWATSRTVTVEVLAEGANDHYAIGAELIISYNFVIPTSGTYTNIKTVNWYIGQETAKGTADPGWTFNTYIPEASATERSAGEEGDYIISNTTADYYMYSGMGGSSSVTRYSTTGENVTLSNTRSATAALTPSSQSNVATNIRVCTDGSCSTGVDSLKSLTAFYTYEVTAPAAPEKALFLIPLAILLPRVAEWWRRMKIQKNLDRRVIYC